MGYVTALMFLAFAACMPAMAWGLVFSEKMPRWWNLATFALFVGPFLLFVLLFVDGMTTRVIEPLVLSWLP